MACLLSTLSFQTLYTSICMPHICPSANDPSPLSSPSPSPKHRRGEHAWMSTERERLDEIEKKIKREPDTAALAVVVAAASASTVPADNHIVVPRRQGLGLGGALNTLTPCAACKLLRRRCAQECPFAPYFSPHEPHKFAAVHKVFGASNVSKMLLEVAEGERADAASSLVYEANLRLRDPVYGCMGAISMLQQQVSALEAELDAVRAEILKHRCRQQATGGNRLIDDDDDDDDAHVTASFVVAPAPAAPVHVNDVVSVAAAAAGQEVTVTGGASGRMMSTSSAVYVAEAEQPSSTTHYSSLNPSEHHPAYFG